MESLFFFICVFLFAMMTTRKMSSINAILMLLILDGNSGHVTHVSSRVGLSKVNFNIVVDQTP